MKPFTYNLFLIGGFCIMAQTANTTWAGDVVVAERFLKQAEENLSPEGKGASQADFDLNNAEDQLKDAAPADRAKFADRIAAARVKIEAGLADERRERLLRVIRRDLDNARDSISSAEVAEQTLKSVQDQLDSEDGRKLVGDADRRALLAEAAGLRKQANAYALKQGYEQVEQKLKRVEEGTPEIVQKLKDRATRDAGRNDSRWLLIELDRVAALLKDCPQEDAQAKALADRHAKARSALVSALDTDEQAEQAAKAAALAKPAPKPGELNAEQEHAVRMFGNAIFDALEKLRELRTGRYKPADLGWDWYKQWEIDPVNSALELCRKANVPDDYMMVLGGHSHRFGDLRAKAETYEADMKAAFSLDPNDAVGYWKNAQTPEILKKYEACKARMTKGLANDKLRIMNEEVLISGMSFDEPPRYIVGYYGEGRKLLVRAEDFAKARIWATQDYNYTNTDTLKMDPHWRVCVYHFDDAGKLLKTVSDRGPGKIVPDEYFKPD